MLVVPITPHGSKSARLNRHIDKIRDGRVQLPEDAEFRAEFVAEFVAFPHGEHADQVDAFTQVGGLDRPKPRTSQHATAGFSAGAHGCWLQQPDFRFGSSEFDHKQAGGAGDLRMARQQ